ncbi:SnoaL-like domain protein [Rhodobacteraceae bacterium THAF1]|uniref:nuclear transport factor 2 family protein n=1 Tax=Palleronia sp. THAF1 TaxID=2587842 RepID=UPI000F3E61A9|nr:nuclear transport factor 2 family protein [Palleronia sp. THAF1]QFU08373.1 SnoaL-like domain protein [Palleronia sp. THAF1]VDC29087.1 SnoaL-like domain protein [Rhodobacteraceae bacterium THAF1]
MTLQDIATQLVEGCRTGAETENLSKLYAQDAVSVEATDYGTGRETHGLEGIRGKHAWWEQTFETLEQVVSDPFLHGEDRFAVTFDVKAKNKEDGSIMPVKEVAVYHVADGKIVREEFFGL